MTVFYKAVALLLIWAMLYTATGYSYAYDPLSRPTGVQSTCSRGTVGTPVASYTYTLGAAGNRLSVQELSGRTVSYTYDDLYRLTSQTIAGTASQNRIVSYQYDSVGNRLNLTSTVPAVPSGLLNGACPEPNRRNANDRLGTDQYDNNGNTINNGGIGNVAACPERRRRNFENHLVQRGNVSIVGACPERL